MSSDSFMILFDVIILCYGVYLVYSGYQMKNTHQPSNLIINQADLVGARDTKSFCEAMFKPTVVFGMMAILYGQFCIHRPVSDPVLLVFEGDEEE